MASCQTSQWGTSSPYVKLTVTENTSSSTATKAVLSWTLQYIASSAASSSYAKAYTVKIAGEEVASSTYSINGVTGTKTITSGSVEIDKGTAAKSVAFSVSFGFNLTWSGTYKGTLTASGSISVAAKTSYTITYNANGGSGAPSSQTKWYGTNIALSSEKPTRTGYTFKGWGTSSSTSTVSYAAGATYSSNSSITLYAIWTASTYTVKFDANGGSGAPSSQTKTHDVSLTLSSTKPTRTNYTFKGWGTSASSTTVAYAAGGSYTKNAAITLYAIWEQSYTKPKVTNFSVERCNSSGTTSETGTYALVKFNWTTSKTVSSIYIAYKTTATTSWSQVSVSGSGTSGTINTVVGSNGISTEQSYDIRVTVADVSGSTQSIKTLPGIALPIDFKVNGKGTSVGKPAEYDNLFDVAWASRFSENTYVGESKAWEDGLTGTKLSPSGGIVIQRASGSSPYLDFRFYGTTGTYDSRIIHVYDTDTAKRYMEFKGAARYSFDNSIYSTKGLGLGVGDTTGKTTLNVACPWADSSNHNIITRNSDGLTSSFGWVGSSSYKTISQLRGQTVKYENSSGTTTLSDERLKKDFANLDGWESFFDALEPCAFRMKNGISGRYHLGFKAQQIEKALTDNNLSTQDFAGFVKMKYTVDEDDPEGSKVYEEAGIKPGDDEYGLIYTEFTALNTYMIQKLSKENAELTKKVEDLEERLVKLEALVKG